MSGANLCEEPLSLTLTSSSSRLIGTGHYLCRGGGGGGEKKKKGGLSYFKLAIGWGGG